MSQLKHTGSLQGRPDDDEPIAQLSLFIVEHGTNMIIDRYYVPVSLHIMEDYHAKIQGFQAQDETLGHNSPEYLSTVLDLVDEMDLTNNIQQWGPFFVKAYQYNECVGTQQIVGNVVVNLSVTLETMEER